MNKTDFLSALNNVNPEFIEEAESYSPVSGTAFTRRRNGKIIPLIASALAAALLIAWLPSVLRKAYTGNRQIQTIPVMRVSVENGGDASNQNSRLFRLESADRSEASLLALSWNSSLSGQSVAVSVKFDWLRLIESNLNSGLREASLNTLFLCRIDLIAETENGIISDTRSGLFSGNDLLGGAKDLNLSVSDGSTLTGAMLFLTTEIIEPDSMATRHKEIISSEMDVT